MSTENLRISEPERARYVDELVRHVGAGRLTVDEFDRRAARIYASDTVAEAREQFTGLPVSMSPERPSAAGRSRRRLSAHQRIEWSIWASVGASNVLVWVLVSLATTSLVYPWPIWVIGPWGLVLLTRTVLGIESPSHAHALRHVRALSGPGGTYGSPSWRSTRG